MRTCVLGLVLSGVQASVRRHAQAMVQTRVQRHLQRVVPALLHAGVRRYLARVVFDCFQWPCRVAERVAPDHGPEGTDAYPEPGALRAKGLARQPGVYQGPCGRFRLISPIRS